MMMTPIKIQKSYDINDKDMDLEGEFPSNEKQKLL